MEAPNYVLDGAFLETKRIVGDSNEVGFVVRTTLDPELQRAAEDAIISVIREEGPAFAVTQAAMVGMDLNGAVRAMVGGVDYGQSQFNRATAPNRQPGSSFKPFVYATAFEMLDITPRSSISDAPVCIGNWCPQNYGRSLSRGNDHQGGGGCLDQHRAGPPFGADGAPAHRRRPTGLASATNFPSPPRWRLASLR